MAPGSGVFEVDREMTSITKQKLVDSGKLKTSAALLDQSYSFGVGSYWFDGRQLG